jgi:PEP-CTERM motif
MHKLGVLVLLPILFLSAVVVRASTIVSLPFQGLHLGEEILGYYNGGFGSLGNGPGPSLGITFNAAAVATDGYYTCQNLGDTCAAVVGGATMDMLGGFDTALSFYSMTTGATVQLYSGLDGTGSLLADVIVPPSTIPWDPFGFTFNGVAHSVVFSGPLEVATLTMGGGFVVPEPSTFLLLATAAASTAWRIRRGVTN